MKENKTATLNIRLTEKEKEEITNFANNLGISSAALIRIALKEYMSKEK